MNLEQALNAWLSELTGLECYWLKRPDDADNAVVYRCISPGIVEANLARTGIREDSYSITIYHRDAEKGKALADAVFKHLDSFNGTINPLTENEYHIQLITFSGGFDQWLSGDEYQFNRDFVFYH
ncbi:hypothetical protein P0F40_000834 [Vibrio metschnikovii]|nr:hypothetical protein [Vibrio metschnikovii]EKO3725792.1 hypothetical protein [Vibrio metschnikovii]EKO3879125.1 hypothetical protein [Vibrio metschnikovii]